MTLRAGVFVVDAFVSMILRSPLPVYRFLRVWLIDKSWVNDMMLRRWWGVVQFMINYISSSEWRLCRVVNVSMTTTNIVNLGHCINLTLLIQKHGSRYVDYLWSWVRLFYEWVHRAAITLLQVVATLVLHHLVIRLLRRQICSGLPRQIAGWTIGTVDLAQVTHPIICLTD